MASHKLNPEPLVKAILLASNKQYDQREFRQCGARKTEDKDEAVKKFLKELQSGDLTHSLKHTLRSAFKDGGQMVLAFPASTSYTQLKQYADNITAEFNKHTKAVQTKCPHITKKAYHSNDNERKLDEDDDDFLDIKVEIVDVKVKSVHHHRMSIIQDVFEEKLGVIPDVDVVKLIDADARNEVLTVNPDSGRVYFKIFTSSAMKLDETSYFFRIQFRPVSQSCRRNVADDDDNPVILLINLKTLLPIDRNKNNELYAVLPSMDMPPDVAHPFHWLPTVVQESLHQSIYFYHQYRLDPGSFILRPANEFKPTKIGISKGKNNIAIVGQCYTKLIVETVDIEGHTN